MSTWLHAIATSVAMNGLRKVKRFRTRETALGEADAVAGGQRTAEPDLKLRLHAAIDALPLKYRTVVVMHDVEGYTHEEIAATLKPVEYYFKVPSGPDARDFFVLDPMLATGGSAIDAVTALKRAGAQRIRFLCLVACPEGVGAMLAHHPDVPVFAAALDRQLNDKGYILPGLGDAGDRLFGTR